MKVVLRNSQDVLEAVKIEKRHCSGTNKVSNWGKVVSVGAFFKNHNSYVDVKIGKQVITVEVGDYLFKDGYTCGENEFNRYYKEYHERAFLKEVKDEYDKT